MREVKGVDPVIDIGVLLQAPAGIVQDGLRGGMHDMVLLSAAPKRSIVHTSHVAYTMNSTIYTDWGLTMLRYASSVPTRAVASSLI